MRKVGAKVANVVYTIIWNAIIFALYGEDKRRKKAGLPRASENMFVAAAFFMGSPGVILGMIIFHQKLRSPKLVLALPFAVILNLLVGLGLLKI